MEFRELTGFQLYRYCRGESCDRCREECGGCVMRAMSRGDFELALNTPVPPAWAHTFELERD